MNSSTVTTVTASSSSSENDAVVVVGQKRSRPKNDSAKYRYYCEDCPESKKKIASYAKIGLKKPTLCAEHVKLKDNKDEYKNVVRKTCKTCDATPSFNYLGEKKPEYCSKCKLVGMVNVVKGTCQFSSGCTTRATFGMEGEFPKYCKLHSEKGMIDLYTKKCVHGDCKKFAMYNENFGMSPLYCKEHGELNGCLVDVKSKRCEVKDCLKHAVMGERNKSKQYCSFHAKELSKVEEVTFINVKAVLCERCDTRALFGFKDSRPSRCAKHFEDGMERLDSSGKKVCAFEDCERRPYYYWENNVTEKFCSSHKKDGMVTMLKMCVTCKKVRAVFEKKGESPRYCFMVLSTHPC